MINWIGCSKLNYDLSYNLHLPDINPSCLWSQTWNFKAFFNALWALFWYSCGLKKESRKHYEIWFYDLTCRFWWLITWGKQTCLWCCPWIYIGDSTFCLIEYINILLYFSRLAPSNLRSSHKVAKSAACASKMHLNSISFVNCLKNRNMLKPNIIKETISENICFVFCFE